MVRSIVHHWLLAHQCWRVLVIGIKRRYFKKLAQRLLHNRAYLFKSKSMMPYRSSPPVQMIARKVFTTVAILVKAAGLHAISRQNTIEQATRRPNSPRGNVASVSGGIW